MDILVQGLSFLFDRLPMIGALLVLMLIDLVTGLGAAAIEKKWNSKISYLAGIRKGMILLAISGTLVLEPYAQDIPISKLLSLFFIITEWLSISENLVRANVPLPQWYQGFLDKVQTDINNPPPTVVIEHATDVKLHGRDQVSSKMNDSSVLLRDVKSAIHKEDRNANDT